MATIDEKNIGDVVLINDSVKERSEYIVIHKGLPSSSYDQSCNGVWLMRKNATPARAYDNENKGNDFDKSNARSYLNINFYYNSNIYNKAKTILLPYYKGNTSSGSVQSGTSKGCSLNVFLLSCNEIGLTSSDLSNSPNIGSVLDYFKNGSKVCLDDNGKAVDWWLRTPVIGNSKASFYLDTSGGIATANVSLEKAIRPAMVVHSKCRVDENNFLQLVNTKPVITSDKSGNLGTLTEGFTCNFSVNDVDSDDTLNTSLKLDNTVIRSFTAVRDQQETYTLGGTDWLKISNGLHNFTITVADGKETVTSTASFTRSCTELSMTLAPPLTTESLCTACNLKIIGNIPSDTEIKCEVCNNAKDAQPAWEDVTPIFRSGLAHVFKNKTAKNGYAVNLRITAKRGSTNSGGFIDKIIFCYE